MTFWTMTFFICKDLHHLSVWASPWILIYKTSRCYKWVTPHKGKPKPNCLPVGRVHDVICWFTFHHSLFCWLSLAGIDNVFFYLSLILCSVCLQPTLSTHCANSRRESMKTLEMNLIWCVVIFEKKDKSQRVWIIPRAYHTSLHAKKLQLTSNLCVNTTNLLFSS